MIVVDANILIRAVLGRRVRQLVDTYEVKGVRFLAPDVAFDDAQKYLPPLLKKRRKPDADVSASLEYLRLVVETVDSELYAVFEKEARQRLRGRDDDDWPVLATALALSCAIWTENADFSELALQYGLQIASRSFYKHKSGQTNLSGSKRLLD